jgi:hypothetical protein
VRHAGSCTVQRVDRILFPNHQQRAIRHSLDSVMDATRYLSARPEDAAVCVDRAAGLSSEKENVVEDDRGVGWRPCQTP